MFVVGIQRTLRLLPVALLFYILSIISNQKWIPLRYSDCSKSNLKVSKTVIHQNDATVHVLWVNGELSRLETLSLASFVKNKFSVNLWTYNTAISAPSGVVVRDAREIIPEERIFYSKSGSLAPYSDLFRYRVLLSEPGLWCDADVICLAEADKFLSTETEAFLVSERLPVPGSLKVNGNVIYWPDNADKTFIKLALNISESLDPSKVHGLEIGPKLMTTLYQSFPNLRPRVMHPNFANGISPWNCPEALLKPKGSIPRGAVFVHCFNEIWRQKGFDKNRPFPEESILWNLEKKYLGDSH
jgi:hypothetical protein